GSLRVALERLARQLGLEGDVTFTGSIGQHDVRRAYENADMFCMASFNEGVPVVLMESMAMELPVVATWVGGIPELVQDHVSGLMVSPGNARDLATGVRMKLDSDVKRRAEMGAAGRERVGEAFAGDV